jgi:hypothetical protein
MCISREHLNLCKCGCPEIVHHEEDFINDVIAEASGFLPRGRGKCHGEIPLRISMEELQALIEEAKTQGRDKVSITQPCDCQEFDPVFKNMCGGMGADPEDDIFGEKL